MAFDFPPGTTVGQTYGNYTWDGEKWLLSMSGGGSSSPWTIDVNGDAILRISGSTVVRIKSTGLILTKDDIEVFSTSV